MPELALDLIERLSLWTPRWLSLAAVSILFLTGCVPNGGPVGAGSCGPAPTTQISLNGATAITASDLWVVGIYQSNGPAVPFTEHWDGSKWMAIDAPSGPWVQGAHLNAVSSAGARDVWSVGAGQSSGEEQTLIEHWDGSGWAIVASPNAGSRTNDLAAVDVIGTSDAWAVGDYLGSVRDLALTEHWDGTSWAVVNAENPAAGINRLAGVASVNATDVWAVGFRRESDSATPQTLIEHWDGLHWKVVVSPSPGRTASLTSVYAIAADNVWAAGNYDDGNTFLPLIEHWDGKSWAIESNPRASNATVQTIVASGPDDIWIGGASSDGHDENWLIQHWDGTGWTKTSPAQGVSGIVNAALAYGGTTWAVGTYRANTCGPDMALIQRWDRNVWSYVPSPHDGHTGV